MRTSRPHSTNQTARATGKPIRVMLVDDSAVVRGLITRWLDKENDIEVVAKAIDGVQGVRFAEEHQPDVVVLDIEMPRMDGITALPQILKVSPKTKVVMASTLTHRNAEITMRALSQGASDYTPKPDSTGLANADEFRKTLIEKIRALGKPAALFAKSIGNRPAPARAIQTAPPANFCKPEAILIGSSTGGPQALRDLITVIGSRLSIPIFITQHMPKTFTKVLAEHLSKVARKPVVEGKDGMPVKSGGIYLAPGDYHMTLRRAGMGVVIGLDQKPPVNYCRPSVDPLFRSAAKVYGKRSMAIMLTGMGHDGCDGTKDMFDSGARVLAQDEASSVVWGMPGAVVKAGLAHQILPMSKIGSTVLQLVQGN